MTKQRTEDKFLQTVRAFQPTCVLTAADLDIFTLLNSNQMTAQSLSALASIGPGIRNRKT